MIYGTITGLIFILGFAYVVWVLANKEAGNIKLAGQVIAVLVVLVALVVLYCGVTGKGHCPTMGGKGMMMGSGMDTKAKCAMMTNMVKKDPKIMTEMCKDPAICKMMKDCIKKCGK